MAEITVYLNRAEDLFQLPDSTPFDPDYVHLPGMQQIVNQLRLIKLSKIHQLTIHLYNSDKTEAQIHAAINLFAKNKLIEIHERKMLLHKDGFIYLGKGILIVLICLFVTYYIGKTDSLPKFIDFFLSEWLVIVGWVSLWRPVDILLFDEMALNREIKIFRLILNLPIVITYKS